MHIFLIRTLLNYGHLSNTHISLLRHDGCTWVILLNFPTLFAFAVSRMNFYSLAKRTFFSRNLICLHHACVQLFRPKIFAFREKKTLVESGLYGLASKRLYFLRLLKWAGLDHSSQLAVYTTCIRSVLEYGCQVWNYGASQYLSDDVERIQRRALRIIYPNLSYRRALEVTSLPSLSQRRDELCRSYFIKMTDSTHKLHYLLPDKRSNSLRNNDNFTYIWSYTNCFKNSYIPSSVVSFNTYNNS